jgi:hypothetical protein
MCAHKAHAGVGRSVPKSVPKRSPATIIRQPTPTQQRSAQAAGYYLKSLYSIGEQPKNDTLEIMRRYECSPQEIHHVEDVNNFDVAGTPPGLTGLKRRHFVRVQRVADISTEHARLARELVKRRG